MYVDVKSGEGRVWIPSSHSPQEQEQQMRSMWPGTAGGRAGAADAEYVARDSRRKSMVYTRDSGNSKKSYEKQGEGGAAGRSISREDKEEQGGGGGGEGGGQRVGRRTRRSEEGEDRGGTREPLANITNLT